MIIFFTIPTIIFILPILFGAGIGASFFSFIANHKTAISIIIGIIGVLVALLQYIATDDDDMRFFKLIINLVMLVSFLFFISAFAAYFTYKERFFLVRLFGCMFYLFIEYLPLAAWAGISLSDDSSNVSVVITGLICAVIALVIGMSLYSDYVVNAPTTEAAMALSYYLSA